MHELASTTVLDLVQSVALAVIAAVAAYLAGRQTNPPQRSRRRTDPPADEPHETSNRS